MKLSILIPTVKGRESHLQSLTADLNRQIAETNATSEVEIVVLSDNKEMTIGDKRTKLYSMAKGKYSVQLDDDDSVHPNYVSLVLNATSKDTDCIGYYESVTWDRKYLGNSHISLRHKAWDENKSGHRFVRTPFHKVPIKTEIAKAVPFKPLRFGEDHEWSKRIYQHLTTEVFIPEVMYFYEYISGDARVKYGMK